MIYTNSVRIAVFRKIIQEKLGIDDKAFEDMCTQEIEKRKAEDIKAREEVKTKAIKEAAKKMQEQSAEQESEEVEVETKEFGGDFGQAVGEEATDKTDTCEGRDVPGAEEPEGPVGDAGPGPDGVQQVAAGEEEGRASVDV